jgi:hypothetical protein
MGRAGTVVTRPTAGERARTLAYGVADGVLAGPGVPYAPVSAHITDDNGRPFLLIPSVSPVVAALQGEPDLPATLRISDVAPVPLADRVRGRAWLHGWITELRGRERHAAAMLLSRLHPRPELLDLAENGEWTLLALEAAEIEIEDSWGTATLEPEEYADAVPDPFVAIEAGILSHLDSCHRAELAALLPNALPGDVRALSLDRYGMWLRCAEQGDVRVVFAEPVSDLHGLRCAYRRLFGVRKP